MKIRGVTDNPFGGKTVVLGGDFRQILPVVPKGSRQDIVNATITSLILWQHCTVLHLTKNMRLHNVSSEAEKIQADNFATWHAGIGNGTVGEFNHGEVDVKLPVDMLVRSNGDPIASIVNEIYPAFRDSIDDPSYMQERAVLAPTLKMVHSINDYMLSLNTCSDSREYLSSDKACGSLTNSSLLSEIHTPEFLNCLNCSGLPNHNLKLKVGTPIMLLRNIDHANGLCNGTRLVTTKLGTHVLEGKIIAGGRVGEKVLIPRMSMSSSDKRLPFTFERKQFPIVVCYAMTINKSQGQSLNHVGLVLREPVFSHGQLYVAFSRVTNPKGLKVLLCGEDDDGNVNCTKNVVYKEVLYNL